MGVRSYRKERAVWKRPYTFVRRRQIVSEAYRCTECSKINMSEIKSSNFTGN